jgi:predicted nucleic acid-binding protein
MDLIIDANILFATLIKDGVTAKLMFVDRLHLYAPEFLLEEFDKYRDEILKKTHRTSENFDEVLSELSARIHYVPMDEFHKMIKVAEEISPDENDSIYFALALKNGLSIWSNDSRLKKQSVVRIYSTSDLMHIFSVDLE